MSLAKLVKLVVTLLVASISMQTHAALILDIDPNNGQLLGAQNVDVNGILYDVQFLDGSCNSLFNDCLTLDFPDQLDAEAATIALLDQVLVDTGSSLFDQDPTLTVGCGSTDFCFIFVPYNLVNTTFVQMAFALNRNGLTSDIASFNALTRTNDLTSAPEAVYAKFTLVPVPEPSVLSLLTLGLVGVSVRQKRSH